MSVILRQSLAAECEPSRSPEVGMDPQEPEVLPILRALPQSWRAGFLPHWEDQVSQVVFQRLPGGIYGCFIAPILRHPINIRQKNKLLHRYIIKPCNK